jgi:hypothetical protein
MNRTITITFTDESGWDVHKDGKCCNGLGWDEMLGQVAVLTMPPARLGTLGKLAMLVQREVSIQLIAPTVADASQHIESMMESP